MHTQTVSYGGSSGWSASIDPANDSTRTLVIAFGSAQFGDDPKPFDELRRVLPNAQLVGCSTAGEIHGAKVCDNSIAVAIVRFEHTSLRATSAHVRRPEDSFGAGLA